MDFAGEHAAAVVFIAKLSHSERNFRGNFERQCGLRGLRSVQRAWHRHQASHLSDLFILIFALIAVIPDKKFPVTFAGKKYHGDLYFALSGFDPDERVRCSGNVSVPESGVCALVSLVMVFLMGSEPIAFVYNKLMEVLERLVFRQAQPEEEET